MDTQDRSGPEARVFVVVMSLVAEPTRRTLNAIILAGASGVYLSGGLGPWELIYPVIATPIAFRGLRSYRWIGVGWLLHAGWDVVHHLWGNPIWPFMPSSAFGCMMFDGLIAPWFLAAAPSLLKRPFAAVRAVRASATDEIAGARVASEVSRLDHTSLTLFGEQHPPRGKQDESRKRVQDPVKALGESRR